MSTSQPKEDLILRLIELPDLALKAIFSHCNIQTLMCLRGTCHTLKKRLDEEKKIPCLKVTLRSEEDLVSITNSTTPWANFCFNWDSLYNITPLRLSKFLDHFLTSIRIFDFSKCMVDDFVIRNKAIVQILLRCEHLTSIKICELSCMEITRSTREGGLEKLKKNWKGLKYLEIKQVLCMDYHGLDYFAELLECCQKLEELNPPIIAISSPEYLSFNYKLFFIDRIAIPIYNFMKSRKNLPNLKKLHLQEHLFDGRPQLLYNIAAICSKLKTILYPQTFLPFSRSIFLDVPVDEEHILYILGNLCGITDKVIEMGLEKPLVNLTFLSISFRSFLISDEMSDMMDIMTPPILILPNLQEVELEMTNDPPWEGRPNKLSRFIRRFCAKPHLSVWKLKLMEVSRAADATMMRAVDMIQGFPNLRHLEISYWDGKSAEFVTLWNNLPRLEEVRLRFCHNLGDDGVFGPDKRHPAMLQLRHLQILMLSEVGHVTDASFVHVFRHMRLQKFFHHNSDCQELTQRGYNSLGTGVFSESIREMFLHCSSHFKMDQYCKFLRQFPGLRTPNFTDSSPEPLPLRSICNKRNTKHCQRRRSFDLDSDIRVTNTCCVVS